jgi:hypothetical protein
MTDNVGRFSARREPDPDRALVNRCPATSLNRTKKAALAASFSCHGGAIVLGVGQIALVANIS